MSGLHVHMGLGSGQGARLLPFIPASNAVVAKGGYMLHESGYASGYTRYERRSRGIIGGQPVKSLRLVFFNGYLSGGEMNGPNAVTYEAAIENLSPLQTARVTFGGAPSATIQPGSFVVSDAVLPSAFGLSVFPANWDFRVRTGMIGSASSVMYYDFPVFETISGLSAVASNAAVSQIAATGPLTVPSGGAANSTIDIVCPGPAAILGEWAGTPDVSVFQNGDSIMAHFNANQDDGGSNGTLFAQGTRGVNGRTIPFVGCARSGYAATFWTNPSNANTFRKWLMQFCTHYVDNLSVNDFNLGQTAAQLLANKQSIWADFRANGKGIKHITDIGIFMHTNTSDSYATIAGQTPITGMETGGALRDALRTSIQALVGQSNGPGEYLNFDSALTDGTHLDKWKVNGTANYGTRDGIHPEQVLHSAAAAIMSTAAAGWTV